MTKEQNDKKTTPKDDDGLARVMAILEFGADVIRINRAAKEKGAATPVVIRGTTSDSSNSGGKEK